MKTDVLVIGGSAAGLVAAMTAKSSHPEKSVTMVRKEEKVMIPCGIPYIFGEIGTSDKNILPDKGLESLSVQILIDEVTDVEKDSKVCKLKEGSDIEYDKLVIATGSLPVVPGWLKGADKENVFTVRKNKSYLDRMMDELKNCNDVVVIGAGFIGVEVSDELKKSGKNVILVELLPHIMGTAFDDEFAEKAEEVLLQRGVTVKTGVGVKEILGKERVTGVSLQNGEELSADAVVLSCGYRPNTDLAKKIGLPLNECGFIKTDQYRRTDVKDVFACGDCSEKRDFATGKLSKIMLASTACAEARVAGMNLYSLSTVKAFNGTIGIYSTLIGGLALGVAGLTEKQALNEGFDIVTGSFTGVDRHPGHLIGNSTQTVKLIVARENGVVLGGEVSGGTSSGELINVIGFAIQNNMTINDFLVAQIGTQPMLTASPAAYPLIKAAEITAKKLKK